MHHPRNLYSTAFLSKTALFLNPLSLSDLSVRWRFNINPIWGLAPNTRAALNQNMWVRINTKGRRREKEKRKECPRGSHLTSCNPLSSQKYGEAPRDEPDDCAPQSQRLPSASSVKTLHQTFIWFSLNINSVCVIIPSSPCSEKKKKKPPRFISHTHAQAEPKWTSWQFHKRNIVWKERSVGWDTFPTLQFCDLVSPDS